jgi:hypothetical protein
MAGCGRKRSLDGVLTISFKSPSHLLVIASVFSLLLCTHASNADEFVDYSPIMKRGFEVHDEPSILERCGGDFSAIRVTELRGGSPIALVRVENPIDGARGTKRLYDDDKLQNAIEFPISEADWKTLATLLRNSGFWTYETDPGTWMPDSGTLWIEACMKSQFRSISIYPERDNRMSEVVGFLAKLSG